MFWKQEVKCEPATVETLLKLVEELPQAVSISSDPFDDVEVAVPVDEVIVKPSVEQTENKAAEVEGQICLKPIHQAHRGAGSGGLLA